MTPPEPPSRPGSLRRVRIATWNVNSVRPRIPRLLPWLEQRRPDVVCLQETKVSDAGFDEALGADLERLGYAYAHHGLGQWNGVALLSRLGLDDPVKGLPDEPGYPDPEARAVTATCGGLRVTSVYVPNGREPGSDHYAYKLRWLAALAGQVRSTSLDQLVCGDINVAPTDLDVFDPSAFAGHTHVTPAEREAVAALGLIDVVRERWKDTPRVFSYWDYRAGMFHKDLGMRIDLVLASQGAAGRVCAAWTDRAARKGTGTSDHAPVIVDLDEAPDGDVGPVVPPASAPAHLPGSKALPQEKDVRRRAGRERS